MTENCCITKIEGLLECTICLDVPASPIHACRNGHVICGICFDKVQECGICESYLAVCPFAERISRQMELKIKCPNEDSGCNKPILASSMKEHISGCYFRDVPCDEWIKEDCNGLLVPLKDYVKHLEEKHGGWVDKDKSPYWKCTIPIIEYQYEVNWPKSPLVKDGFNFIFHGWKNEEAVYCWITILGTKEQSERYIYEITLRKISEQVNMPKKCCWTLPVLPFHDHPKFQEASSKLYVTIPTNIFLDFCIISEDKEKYEVEVSHQVIAV